MGRTGFVTDEYVANSLIFEQGIVNRQYRAAGIAEYIFDALTNEAFDQYARAAALCTHVTFLTYWRT